MKQEDVERLCNVASDGTCTCKKCGSEIMCIEQRRSVWEFPELCAGSGKVVTEIVPYCPKCEPKPSARGTPITPSGSGDFQ